MSGDGKRSAGLRPQAAAPILELFAIPGLVNFSNVGTGGFLNGVNVTTDQTPDIIVKAA